MLNISITKQIGLQVSFTSLKQLHLLLAALEIIVLRPWQLYDQLLFAQWDIIIKIINTNGLDYNSDKNVQAIQQQFLFSILSSWGHGNHNLHFQISHR